MPVTIGEMNATPTPAQSPQPGQSEPAAITPELVRQVADRVYALLREELKLERERHALMKGNRYVRY